MNRIKSIIHFLPFLGIVFAFMYFYKTMNISLDLKYLKKSSLIISLFLLMIVFFYRAILWHLLLDRFNINVRFVVSIESRFKPILLKYIPGKIWVLIGAANIIAKSGYSLSYCSFISIFYQIIMIMSGVFVGILGILYFNFYNLSLYFTCFLLIAFIGLLFYFSRPHVFFKKKCKYIPKRFNLLFNRRKIPPVADLIFFCILQWLLLGVAYWFFIRAISGSIGLMPILLQPLANNIGIIATFAPSGLGVREGVMIGYLYLAGETVNSASNIAIASRIWFFFVEIIVFLIGLVLKKCLSVIKNNNFVKGYLE